MHNGELYFTIFLSQFWKKQPQSLILPFFLLRPGCCFCEWNIRLSNLWRLSIQCFCYLLFKLNQSRILRVNILARVTWVLMVLRQMKIGSLPSKKCCSRYEEGHYLYIDADYIRWIRANYPEVNISICAEQDSGSLLDSFPHLAPIILKIRQ